MHEEKLRQGSLASEPGGVLLFPSSMPIIQSAKKKMRQDKKRTERNKLKKDNVKALIKNMRRDPSTEVYSKLSSALDKSVKTKFIHPNKASRLKSRLSKLIVVAK